MGSYNIEAALVLMGTVIAGIAAINLLFQGCRFLYQGNLIILQIVVGGLAAMFLLWLLSDNVVGNLTNVTLTTHWVVSFVESFIKVILILFRMIIPK